MISWKKQGRIFVPDGTKPWSRSYAQVPTVCPMGTDRLRIYYGTRDDRNRTLPSFIEVDAADPSRILYVHPEPLLSLGKPGTHDDCGVMPIWALIHEGRTFLYFNGINVGTTVPFRYTVGLAISDDGIHFERVSDGPVMDRTIEDPILVGSPSVLIENGIWRAWYLSGTGWAQFGERFEPLYNIRYAESNDGISWKRTGRVCVDVRPGEGAVGRAVVLKDTGLYRMWYSYRGARDYRTDLRESYRIGYAESPDGLTWVRRDEDAGIDVSSEGWDSEMIAYGFVVRNGAGLLMVYNGNGFGRSGFGYATSNGFSGSC